MKLWRLTRAPFVALDGQGALLNGARYAPAGLPDDQGEDAIRAFVGGWFESKRSLLAAVRSKVLPEADVVLLNPAHPDAAGVPPLTCRAFSFAECLHTPPMLAQFQGRS